MEVQIELVGEAAAKAVGVVCATSMSKTRRNGTIFFNMYKWIVALLIVVGVAVSVWDYKNWKYEETRNYGYGPDTAFSLVINRTYQNKLAGVRIRYPGEWEVKVNPKFEVKNLKLTFNDVVTKNDRVWVVKLGGKMTVYVARLTKNMPDEVNNEVALINKISKLNREREYVGTVAGTAVVLSWENEGTFYQRGMLSGNGKMVIVDLVDADATTKEVMEKTLIEMLKSVVLI